MRPNTLASAFERIAAGAPLAKAIPEFLDTFYGAEERAKRSNCLAAKPPAMVDNRLDAYAGAVAEYLAKTFDAQIPAWAGDGDRYLKTPWFTVPDARPAMIEYLVHSSPAEFRSRNIFTESRPLRRASQAKLRARSVADGVASPDDGG